MGYDHKAVRKAYPNVVRIDDSVGIFDASGNAVSVEQSKIDAARVEINKLNYRGDRMSGTATTTGYLKITEQLDQLYHDINAGKFGADAKTGEWFVGITSVKTAFPKLS